MSIIKSLFAINSNPSFFFNIASFYLIMTGNVWGQIPLPVDFNKAKEVEYNTTKFSDSISFEQYFEAEKLRYIQTKEIESDPTKKYVPSVLGTSCGNGDFETGINPFEWQGGWNYLPVSGVPNYSTMISGIIANHQTSTLSGFDPIIPTLSTVAPGGSTKSARVGRDVSNSSCDVLSKTFVVTSTVTRFWYALVMYPVLSYHIQHNDDEDPKFSVRVLNSSLNEIPGAIDLFGGKPYILGDITNPFLQKYTHWYYRDWTCAEIVLSKSYIGQTITVQFVTEDCPFSVHSAYAYIDNFCGDCGPNQEGSFSYDPKTSNCEDNNICFNFKLPRNGGSLGTIQITLEILQNGVTVQTLNSPLLTYGTSHCFKVDPCKTKGINPLIGGYDFVATANLAIGGTIIGSIMSGSKPDGQLTGKNNDCKKKCGPN